MYQFVVNDESIVNEYGYRVMTGGISTAQYMRNPVVLYMHNRDYRDPSSVIGRCLRLEHKNGQLVADIEFDRSDEFAKKVEAKVAGGFIRMASIYADIQDTSAEDIYLLPRQRYETITKCKLVEISIVDIGGNDNALKLKKGADTLGLKIINQNKKEKPMDFKKMLSFSLKKDGEAGEAELLAEVQALKQDNEALALKLKASEAEAIQLGKALEEVRDAEAVRLVDRAVALGLLSESLKAAQINALKADYEHQKAMLSKLIEAQETKSSPGEKNSALKEIFQSKNPGGASLSFDKLQKENPAELKRIKEQQPELYTKLAKDYAAGK